MTLPANITTIINIFCPSYRSYSTYVASSASLRKKAQENGPHKTINHSVPNVAKCSPVLKILSPANTHTRMNDKSVVKQHITPYMLSNTTINHNAFFQIAAATSCVPRWWPAAIYINKQSWTMQLGGRKGIRPVKTWGGYGDGVVSSVGVVPTWTVGASASIFILCSTKPRRSFMMAYNSDIGLDPWATPHAYVNRRWGYPAGTQHSPMPRQKAVYIDR